MMLGTSVTDEVFHSILVYCPSFSGRYTNKDWYRQVQLFLGSSLVSAYFPEANYEKVYKTFEEGAPSSGIHVSPTNMSALEKNLIILFWDSTDSLETFKWVTCELKRFGFLLKGRLGDTSPFGARLSDLIYNNDLPRFKYLVDQAPRSYYEQNFTGQISGVFERIMGVFVCQILYKRYSESSMEVYKQYNEGKETYITSFSELKDRGVKFFEDPEEFFRKFDERLRLLGD